MAVMYIAVIAESEYPAFREICNRNEFPSDFGAFLRRVERRKSDLHERGFIVREVNIDAAGFKRRRRPRTGATYRELDRYAASLVYQKQKRK